MRETGESTKKDFSLSFLFGSATIALIWHGISIFLQILPLLDLAS